MTDTNEPYRLLVNKLLAQTKKEKVKWEISWGNKLDCEFGGYTIRLESGETPEGEPLEIISLIDDNSVIDTFSDAEITEFASDNYWSKMVELRKIANRQARGVDKAIKIILDNLSDDFDDLA